MIEFRLLRRDDGPGLMDVWFEHGMLIKKWAVLQYRETIHPMLRESDDQPWSEWRDVKVEDE